MSSTNDITGDRLTSKPSNDAYRNSPFWETRVVYKTASKEENEGDLYESLTGHRSEVLDASQEKDSKEKT